jgi:hypothetical protein
MTETVKAYCRIVGSKGSDAGPYWYEIFSDRPSGLRANYRGPFRDTTDAENAAHDEAERRGLDLEFTD